MTSPDVTVVVAVYNTMPYLTECLNSLVGQSIGLSRLEIVAVDDGSTDDSGTELDRFAEKYPDTVRVLHQANSGGPAAPSNRALDLAAGRYVYFVGSDDFLGEEALERMVACADENASDVVVGRMVGTNGRHVHQALYRENDPDVDLYDSALPFTLANTKLFRRSLVEEHGLRFPEDLPVGSDQPFTVEACVRARRISVIADYTCYYAVKRGDASNITYRADHLSRLRCTAAIMKHAAGLIEAGPKRDAVLRRHFIWELAKLVQDDFPSLDAAVQREICAGIGQLADAYFTEGVADSMDVKRRIRIALAGSGAVDELVLAIRSEAEHGAPPFHLEDGRAFARYPGFRDERLGVPDRRYELVGEFVPGRLAARTELLSVAWSGRGRSAALALTVRVGVTGDTSAAVLGTVSGSMPVGADKAGARRLPAGHEGAPPPAAQTSSTDPDGQGTVLRAELPLRRRSGTLAARAYLELAGTTYEIPLRTGDVPLPGPRRWYTGRYRVTPTTNPKGRLVVTSVPLSSVLRSRLKRKAS
ncbi:glycosyltransferase family 2 protein [Streptacidiphilus cavernicola]|uniref:Glycosyltransferase family 2 protein n=1 Tax=Streptacidiphilus cavernicola TaxID=3342716 RepID=A0ABV6VS53_9ACTN